MYILFWDYDLIACIVTLSHIRKLNYDLHSPRFKESGKGPFTFFNVVPELILAGTFFKSLWKFHWTGAQVPEQDPKGVDVDRVVIFSCRETMPQWRQVKTWHTKQAAVMTSCSYNFLFLMHCPIIIPVNSSGAMWMGVPTMLPDIMASGLQKPRSVIFARFCLSN